MAEAAPSAMRLSGIHVGGALEEHAQPIRPVVELAGAPSRSAGEW
jgi:hypothetical protein